MQLMVVQPNGESQPKYPLIPPVSILLRPEPTPCRDLTPQPQVLSQRNATELQRMQLMVVQPKSEPKYTPTGFEKKRCPFALYQALSGYLNASWGQVGRWRVGGDVGRWVGR